MHWDLKSYLIENRQNAHVRSRHSIHYLLIAANKPTIDPLNAGLKTKAHANTAQQ